MKKFVALMLALCMALAIIPALAENDFTGTWYMVLSGMNCGTFELNADGTCNATSAMSGTEVKATGSWSADGDKVTLTLPDDKPLTLTFDGTDLTVGTDAVAGSEEASKLVSTLVKFTRDATAVTMDEINAYMANGTIPEGKTAAEMEMVEGQLAMCFLIALFMK